MPFCSLAFDMTSTSKSYSTSLSAVSKSELESKLASLDDIIKRYDFTSFYSGFPKEMPELNFFFHSATVCNFLINAHVRRFY